MEELEDALLRLPVITDVDEDAGDLSKSFVDAMLIFVALLAYDFTVMFRLFRRRSDKEDRDQR